jgi:hypothetical protein
MTTQTDATTQTTAAPRRRLGHSLRLGLSLWLAGMLGAVSVTATVLPRLSAGMTLPAPLWLISLAGVCQSALLVAVAVWAGVRLAPAVGLHAPGFEAFAAHRPIAAALRPQLLPGLVGGVPGGIFLYGAFRFAPPFVKDLSERFNPPLFARMLEGGITEEVLLRWGFMTALAWLAWRFLQGRGGDVRGGAVRPALVWVAIVASAFVFGLGHLPLAFHLAGGLDLTLVLFVTGLNAAFGMLFGYLFWRWGLEAAMIAHAAAHLVNYGATLFGARHT